MFVRVVDINDVIVAISIFLDYRFFHLVWHFILPVFWSRFEASWMNWIDLSQSLIGIIFLIESLVANLSVLTKCMLILAWSIHINDIIVAISIFLNDWFQHLVWHFVLPVFWWWLESSWVQWINLNQ